MKYKGHVWVYTGENKRQNKHREIRRAAPVSTEFLSQDGFIRSNPNRWVKIGHIKLKKGHLTMHIIIIYNIYLYKFI